MSEYNTSSVKTVSDAIKSKRKRKRKYMFRKWFLITLSLCVIMIIAFGAYKLDESTLFRVQSIRVSNNHVLSEQQVIDAFEVSINDRIWLIHSFMLNSKIQEYPSIESFKLEKKNNILFINVSEFDVVGVKEDQLLLENGSYVNVTDYNNHYIAKVPEINGFDDEQLTIRLAESLATLAPEIRMIIASVTQNETTYDQAQLYMILVDHKQVFSDFRSLELLNNYPLFVDQIAQENNCIYLDYTSSSARSSVCE